MSIQIYTKENCPACQETKQLLNSNDVDYEEHVVGKTITRDEVLQLFPDAKQVPIILINNQHRVAGNPELKLLLERNQLNLI